MKVERSNRGFPALHHPVYIPNPGPLPQPGDGDTRIVSQSSAIDFDAPGGLEEPGSSYLWVGRHWHLNRAEVRQLVEHLEAWLDAGSLADVPQRT